MFYQIAISGHSYNSLHWYESPERICIGERVLVSYKGRKAVGYVVGCSEHSPGECLGTVVERLDFASFLEDWRVRALLRTAEKHGGGYGKYFDLCFPPRFDDYYVLYVESLSPLLNFERITFQEFKKIPNYKDYIQNGLVRIYKDFSVKTPKPREEYYVTLKVSPTSIQSVRLTSAQSRVVNYLLVNDGASLSEVLEMTEVSRDVIVQLKNKGIVLLSKEPVLHNVQRNGVQLSQEQINSVEAIKTSKGHTLLMGPTGSGKTEVYLEVMKNYLSIGRVLYLVPEVSLTEQTLARIKRKFPELSVSTYHSYLTDAKRVEVWARAVRGEIDVLVGPRSAAFVPLKNLKLVIVDEEHDESYHNNSEPSYWLHTLLENFPVKIVYGSATPSLKHYYLARQVGSMNFAMLTKRYNVELPQVQVVDMKREKRVSNSISQTLYEEIKKTIEEGKSVLVFTRRKGFSRVQCAVCGYMLKCHQCDVSLVYHSDSEILKCHVCGYQTKLTSSCPQCGSTMFIDKGTGTEKIERELRLLFPGRVIGRLDAEVADEPEKIKQVFEQLREGKVDILVGTKMITKGLDIYRIGLVGVVDVDALVSYPDVNAPLRTFQLLVQVVGRSGRNEKGTAVIQTYTPEHPVITYAQLQDVDSYYEAELRLRKVLRYPPFSEMVELIYANSNKETAFETAEVAVSKIEAVLSMDEEVLGPTEPPIPKMMNKYRYQIIVKTLDARKIIRLSEELKRDFPGDWQARVIEI